MDYNTYIDAAIQYIEENLQNLISLEDVAKVAGYSKYHFIGVFRHVLGMTPADYIRKRRISEIVRCMEHDDRPIFDIAFTYGFQSKENFTRAFKREHRILPTEFRYAQNSLKLYDRIYPQTAVPQVELVQMPSFRLVAYKCTEDTPPAF